MKKILVIGASGRLGRPVAKELIQAGFTVTLLARDVAKMKALFPGAHIAAGNVFDKASLQTAMAGQYMVYCNLSVHPASRIKDAQPEREGIANIIAAAQQAQVQRLGYLSSLVQQYEGTHPFNWWVFAIKQAACQAIRASGLTFSIFYPSMFMETIPGILLKGHWLLLPAQPGQPMWLLAGKDYGTQVAWHCRFAGKESHEYTMQGPEPFTLQQAAQVFADHYPHKKITLRKLPLGALKLMGRVSPAANYGYHLLTALCHYPEVFTSEVTWQQLGKPVVTLKAFAEGYNRP